MVSDEIYKAWEHFKELKEVHLESEMADFRSGYLGSQPDAINALCDKIEHMSVNIGCPNSVSEMLRSIVSGKLKSYGEPKGYWTRVGKQHEKYKEYSTIHKLPKVLSIDVQHKLYDKVRRGHFRWGTAFSSTKGIWNLDRETRDYINHFFFQECDNPFTGRLTFSIRSYKIESWEGCVTIEITTTDGNDYRYTYYPDIDKISWQLSTDIPKHDEVWVRNVLKNHIKK